MKKITESASNFDNLENMSVHELLTNINSEDHNVPAAVEKIIPEITAFVQDTFQNMKKGGRLFYLGAGTSGRLGILDASECPPTFGVDHGVVIGLIAGGDQAIRKAVEHAEDDLNQGWKDLQTYAINKLDTVVGIAASGTTPYVIGALEKARLNGNITASITCNPGSPVTEVAAYNMVPVVGPEFVTGSTRMKSGTAQKLVLNMISTSLMIQLGHVEGNKMVDMQLSNAKLVQRGSLMVSETLDISITEAKELLLAHGSVRKAVQFYTKNKGNN